MKTKSDITIAPAKKYAPPKYPAMAEAKSEPGLLKKLPSQWEKNAAIVAAVGMLGMISLTGCEIFDSKIAGYNPNSENYLNVAPVFAHGEGTGSIGCDMVAPPVFLSEEEALAIIKSAARDSGLKFSAKPPEYTATNNKPEPKSQYSWENPKYTLGEGSVGVDLYDDKKGVAVTFISMEAAARNPNMSTITLYRPRELAELTAEDFAGQRGDIALGVFYDPGTNWESEEHQRVLNEYYDNRENDWEERRAQYESDARTLIEDDLRAQVRDFIEWLQGQGII
jgi:hypothetical protein